MSEARIDQIDGAEQAAPRPRILTGFIIGGLLTAPFLTIFYLGDQLFGLPFVPFDLFDWLARILPGDVIRFGIARIVDFIEAFNLGETSSAAKTLEQIQGVLFVLGIGALAGGLLYTALKRVSTSGIVTLSITGGLLLGAFFVLINLLLRSDSAFVEQADPVISLTWIMLVFAAWGMVMAWIYQRLNAIQPVGWVGVPPVAPPAPDVSPAETTPPATVTTTSIEAVQMNRRQFLVRVGGATATLTVVGSGLGALVNLIGRDSNDVIAGGLETVALPPDVPDRGGITPVPGTRPEYTPLDDHYRIDISARPPIINGETYRLRVNGMLQEPLEISLSEIMNDYEPVDHFVTLSCISNRIAGDLISTTRWTGVPFHLLLDDWNLLDDATHLRIISADGFDEWVEIDLIRNDPRVMMCYAWDGQPLKQKHGFPLRIWIPDLYGMKQPKWITEIQAVSEWEPGYWVQRGWDAVAEVQPVSVIDTVAVNAAFERDGEIIVPVGGIAYSGAKGISKVEVSIGDDEWREAQLREPLSGTTWTLWRYDWPFKPGNQQFQVRAYTADGELQPITQRGVAPSGATGIHSVSTRIPDDVAVAIPDEADAG